MSKARILIVHPEPSLLALLSSMLQSLGHGIDEASNERVAVRMLERGGINLVLAGVDPSDGDCLELLTYVRRKQPQVPVILLFPTPHPDRAREATRNGATAVLKFPIPATELRAVVTQACESLRQGSSSSPSGNGHSQSAPATSFTSNGNGTYRPVPAAPVSLAPAPSGPVRNEQPAAPIGGPSVLGEDTGLKQAVELASTVAATKTPVLIVGEQGTGKSLIARTIHQQCSRRDSPFLEVACSGVDELALERELFGQKIDDPEAAIDRPGKLARADGGTLLLDEVAALSPSLQAQLLRVIQEGVFEPLGSTKSIRVDLRFILATRENLPALVEQGKFLRELYERISLICLKLPPLRARGSDIEILAEHFRTKYAREFAKPTVQFAPDAIELMYRHDWPGNVRELESVVQRGVALSQGSRITPANLSIGQSPSRSSRPVHNPKPHLSMELRPLKEALEEPEKQIIIQALRALNWNRQETARVLDINRTTLYKKMKKYGLLMDEPALLN